MKRIPVSAHRTVRRWFALIAAPAMLVATHDYAQGMHPDVDDETCLSCHEEFDRGLFETSHRLTTDQNAPAVEIYCTSCHEGGGQHVEDPSPETITNPGRGSHQDVRLLCENCHTAHRETNNIGFDAHLDRGLSCVSCHSVHSSDDRHRLDATTRACLDCHVALVSDWTRRSVHPIAEQDISCLSCHGFTGALEPAAGHGPTENCYRCHPEVSGPFVWDHDATSSFAVNGEGCVACHSAHGSTLDRLLTQPGDALCTQCHAVPPLHRVNHSGIGTQYLCIECHSEVHGSDDNKHFLDLNLGTKIGGTPPTCYCHGVN